MNSYLRFLYVHSHVYFTLLSISCISFLFYVLSVHAEEGVASSVDNIAIETTTFSGELSKDISNLSEPDGIKSIQSKMDKYLSQSEEFIKKCNELALPYYGEYFNKLIEWYDRNNTESDYLKGIIQIKILDFFLLTFSFIFICCIIIRGLIHD